MKTEAYLSSARGYSLIVLVALFVDCTIAASQAQRTEWLTDAREICLRELILDTLHNDHTTPLQYQEFKSKTHKIYVPGEANGEITFTGDTYGSGMWSLTVDKSGQELWTSSSQEEVLDWSTINDKPPYFRDALKDLALEVGLHVTENSSFDSLFSDIERELTHQQVTIPGVEATFEVSVAPWIISVLVLVLLTMIRNAVRRVMTDSDLATEESWIALDGEKGLEKAVAFSWLGAIFIAPWIASTCLLVMFSGQIIVKGTVGSVLIFSLACAAALSLEVVGGWASLTTTSDLIRLRHLRNEATVS
jgi:hypothetical protein